MHQREQILRLIESAESKLQFAKDLLRRMPTAEQAERARAIDEDPPPGAPDP